VADWKQVRRIALALPETREGISYGHASWTVRDKMFAWERPLRPSDLRALGIEKMTRPILGVRVASLLVKEALLAADKVACFTTPHFDGYPAVLIYLDTIKVASLEDRLVEAWLARAPKKLVKEYLEGRG